MLERCVDRAVLLTIFFMAIARTYTVCRADLDLASAETVIASNSQKTVVRNPKLRKTVFNVEK